MSNLRIFWKYLHSRLKKPCFCLKQDALPAHFVTAGPCCVPPKYPDILKECPIDGSFYLYLRLLLENKFLIRAIPL